MTAKTMAEVLHQEGAWCGNCEFEGWDSCKDCRDTCEGYARALSAAGFGLVSDAKAEATHEVIEHAYARQHGYFWRPCPNCGRMFGGHQTGKGRTPDPDRPGISTMWCQRCDIYATAAS